MKTLKYISALLVMASALLPSCMLLDSSPIHTPRPHPYISPYGPRPFSWNLKTYNSSFEVPVEGGIYEFESSSDQVYIARVFDSSMSVPQTRSDSHYTPTANDYMTVNDTYYCGQFYIITCDEKKHNWIIEVDPLMASPDDLYGREIWVFMWDGSDDSHFVFRFEQTDDVDDGYIE